MTDTRDEDEKAGTPPQQPPQQYIAHPVTLVSAMRRVLSELPYNKVSELIKAMDELQRPVTIME